MIKRRYYSNIYDSYPRLTPVVRKVDNAIHRINHYPVDSAVCFVNTYPLDREIYPVDSVIQPSNNWAQVTGSIKYREQMASGRQISFDRKYGEGSAVA